MSEFFQPTEAELDQMIREVQKKMDSAIEKAEYDQLHDQLKDLRERKRKLIITNNAL